MCDMNVVCFNFITLEDWGFFYVNGQCSLMGDVFFVFCFF